MLCDNSSYSPCKLYIRTVDGFVRVNKSQIIFLLPGIAHAIIAVDGLAVLEQVLLLNLHTLVNPITKISGKSPAVKESNNILHCESKLSTRQSGDTMYKQKFDKNRNRRCVIRKIPAIRNSNNT